MYLERLGISAWRKNKIFAKKSILLSTQLIQLSVEGGLQVSHGRSPNLPLLT